MTKMEELEAAIWALTAPCHELTHEKAQLLVSELRRLQGAERVARQGDAMRKLEDLRKEPIVAVCVMLMRSLSDDGRREVISEFCRNCGSDSACCYCTSDD